MKTVANEQDLNIKCKPVLKYTVQAYIETGEPVSSSLLLSKYAATNPEINFSSAKIRYLMNELEDEGYLAKSAHTSGRIPTLKGLNYYAKYLLNKSNNSIESRLEAILANKNVQIDTTVDQAAQIIADMTGFTMITSHAEADTLLLKSIELVELDKNKAAIVMVVSNGEVFSKVMDITNEKYKMKDVRIAIKIFKERLVDSLLSEINDKLEILKDILAQSVKQYQELINAFVKNIFVNIANRTKSKNNIYGKNNIILSPNIDRESLNKMIDLIENHSVWESIEADIDEDEKIKIHIDQTGSYMSKKIQIGNNPSSVTEISVVGATKSDYDAMHSAIKILDKFLNRK
ncbi:heat-inducible transcriptional repressor HrcA [Mycoplasma sp. Pen4]|uniref:heat-inducible transcriptional repressor HrcA n=1 Tax=Mycoplasma sp. Pen4 TaxID=640330 RepID=UPI0016549D0C|nr:heat-inducible transcriptional repressor HrcA [Mycoplasma sp. Pen4]QNM93781.1 heat-inducible transcriptional repressor HrcA [Mycoplasma sp. Pen4]